MSDELLSLFSARLERSGDSFTIDVPESEITTGPLESGQIYRVAVLHAKRGRKNADENLAESSDADPEPPVEAGEIVELEIEDIGDRGDGIARIDSGFVVFVPNTTLGERVTVEITEARKTMAFAEVIGRQDR